MSDPRLNSIHLESFRREEFRRAREMLLGAVGDQTQNLAGIVQLDRGPPAESRTLHQSSADRLPVSQDYVLVEKDAIYRLKVGLNTIGRLSDNDVVIPDPYLSRRHCAVLVHASKGCELHGHGSKPMPPAGRSPESTGVATRRAARAPERELPRRRGQRSPSP